MSDLCIAIVAGLISTIGGGLVLTHLSRGSGDRPSAPSQQVAITGDRNLVTQSTANYNTTVVHQRLETAKQPSSSDDEVGLMMAAGFAVAAAALAFFLVWPVAWVLVLGLAVATSGGTLVACRATAAVPEHRRTVVLIGLLSVAATILACWWSITGGPYGPGMLGIEHTLVDRSRVSTMVLTCGHMCWAGVGWT